MCSFMIYIGFSRELQLRKPTLCAPEFQSARIPKWNEPKKLTEGVNLTVELPIGMMSIENRYFCQKIGFGNRYERLF